MIRRHRFVFTFGLIALGVSLLIKNPFSSNVQRAPALSLSRFPRQSLDVNDFKINGKKVLGLNPGREKEEFKKLQVANISSPQWETELEKILHLQGGESLKKIELKKVDSFVWVENGIALLVESVIVTLRNDKNTETTFNVLVDAQNGKILKNWGPPVIDPIHSKNNFQVRIDPRYHVE